jgi:glycosyltransferase involved in cell wall biosynthesis
MKSTQKTLSIILPAYNEAGAIANTVKGVDTAVKRLVGDDYEIIVVNDGSRDNTGQILKDLAKSVKKLTVIEHKTNLGYGAALRSGLEKADSKWVAYMDSDGQFNPNDLKLLLDETPNSNVVIGYRRFRQDNVVRRFNTWVWHLTVRLTTGLKVKDLDCGFKLFDGEVLRKTFPLTAEGAVVSVELLTKLKKQNAKWVEVEVRHYPRRSGKPTGANLSVVIKAIYELSRLGRVQT